MITYLKNLEYKDGKLLRNGKPLGHKAKNGYTVIYYKGKKYGAHRLIYLKHHGYLPKEVDHKNRDRSDNRIGNLRDATRSDNVKNSKIRVDNTSGTKGVTWNKSVNKWQVVVQRKYFGIFNDLELAELVATEARNKYHKEYARHA